MGKKRLETTTLNHQPRPAGIGTQAAFGFPAGGGQMGERIRAFDWSRTPLGPPDGWPACLRTMVNSLLASQFAMALLWGPDLILIYNDAYSVICGNKHPSALGKSTREVWLEVWHINQPIFAAVMERGETLFFEDKLFPINRHGCTEEAFFTLCYSPVRVENGTIGGALVVLQETTERKRAEEAQSNELLYRSLLDNSGTAFQLLEPILDEAGSVCDIRYVRVNAAFEALSGGYRAPGIVGRTMKELYPQAEPFWFDACEKVLKSGQPGKAEHYNRDTNRWYGIQYFPHGKKQIASLFSDITERKRAEEALDDSRRQLQSILDTSRDLTYRLDSRTGDFVYCSPSVKAILGYSAEEFVRLSPAGQLARIHPEDVEEVRSALQTLNASGHRYIEYRFKTKSGEYRWLSAELTSVKDADGQPAYRDGSIRDITERKQAEEALRWQNAIQQSIQAVLNAAMTCATEEELGRACLAEAEKLSQSKFGFLDEINAGGELDVIAISDPGWDASLIPLSQRQPPRNMAIRGIYGRVIQDGKGFFTNAPAAHPDRIGLPRGHPPLTAFLGVPLIREGRTIGMIAVGNREGGYTQTQQDALEALVPAVVEAFIRKRAEDALRESEERFKALSQTSPIGVGVSSAEGVIVYTNPAYERILGYHPGEIVGRKSTDLYWNPEERESWLAALKKKGVVQDFEVRLKKKDGTPVWVSINTCPISFGGKSAVMGAIQDITERKKAEETTAAALHEKEVLLKEIHHRVKNNIQIISSLVSLQSDAIADPALKAVFDDVRHQVRTMALVHEKLYQSESVARIDFADYARGLLSYLERMYGNAASGVRVEFDTEPVLLSVETAVPCGLILNELATNAFKHAFRDRATGRIVVQLKTDGEGRVRLGVRDDGVGLPAGMNWRQTRSLGLQLVQILAQQMRGILELGPKPGTAFCVTFTQPVSHT